MRIVLDTNIIISALFHEGKPKRPIDAAVDGKFELVSSSETIDEFRRVISREKFKLSRSEQDLFVGLS